MAGDPPCWVDEARSNQYSLSHSGGVPQTAEGRSEHDASCLGAAVAHSSKNGVLGLAMGCIGMPPSATAFDLSRSGVL